MKAFYIKHDLVLNFKANTSRGSIKTRRVWYIILHDRVSKLYGFGEAAPLEGLSIENLEKMDETLQELCNAINTSTNLTLAELLTNLDIIAFPSIVFALETAFLDIAQNGSRVLFPQIFTNGSFSIPINGLVWMDTKENMLQQIDHKIQSGFNCIKLKIGALDFEAELEVLEYIRQKYSSNNLVLRLDANGAFAPDMALQKLTALAAYDIHSIEQPIAAGHWKEMSALCTSSPIPVALDEELIGVFDYETKRTLLETIRPAYVIFKPSLIGGMGACAEWIELCGAAHIGWWFTSALESNIGLNAISQFAAFKKAEGYQGLGTGKLYHNNIFAPLVINNGNLQYNPALSWDLSFLLNGFSVT